MNLEKDFYISKIIDNDAAIFYRHKELNIQVSFVKVYQTFRDDNEYKSKIIDEKISWWFLSEINFNLSKIIKKNHFGKSSNIKELDGTHPNSVSEEYLSLLLLKYSQL